MTRIHIVCEGWTEQTFINSLMVEPFANRGIYLFPQRIGRQGKKGGDVRFDRLYADVRNLLKGDSTAYCTTLIDFYQLPANFPGKKESAEKNSIADKAQSVNEAMMNALADDRYLGGNLIKRFIPYVQMHEFEGLLFSDPSLLASAVAPKCNDDKIKQKLPETFHEIRSKFSSPEEINDNISTAPSKRILNYVPRYKKVADGANAAKAIGLATIRRECQLFNAWLEKLEALGS